jgi:hypothetical protein
MKYAFKIILSALCLFAPLASSCQANRNESMRMDSELWDFGKIKEEAGEITHTFNFTNAGTTPMVIEQVAVSCGCVVTDYTKKAVASGGKGYIKVTYNPHNRSGKITQNVYVTSGGIVTTLKVSGEVIPRPRSVEDDYPFLGGGGMRYSGKALNFRFIEQGSLMSMTLKYINTSDKEAVLRFDEQPENPALKIHAPEKVCAGCKGEITVIYKFEKGVYGRFADRVYAVVNGVREDLPFSFTAISVDKMTEDKNAPVATIAPLYYHFGDVQRSDKLRCRFKITNTGKSPLIVRWVGHKQELSTSLKAGTTIAPGKSANVDVSWSVANADSGTVTASLMVIFNDPVRPLRDIRVAANLP